jgi:hypothetical protein
MRTLEILAVGCLPYYLALEGVGEYGLNNLPREVLLLVQDHLPGLVRPGSRITAAGRWKFTSLRPVNYKELNITRYNHIVDKLLTYTRKSLTPDVGMRHILAQLHLPAFPRNVLVILAHDVVGMGYLGISFMFGMYALNITVTEVPRQEELYNTTECHKFRHYGNGYTVYCRIKEYPHVRRDNIAERILAKEFDLIAYRFFDNPDQLAPHFHTTMPYFKEVTSTLDPKRIVFLNDRDQVRKWYEDKTVEGLQGKGTIFMREAHGCKEDLVYNK